MPRRAPRRQSVELTLRRKHAKNLRKLRRGESESQPAPKKKLKKKAPPAKSKKAAPKKVVPRKPRQKKVAAKKVGDKEEKKRRRRCQRPGGADDIPADQRPGASGVMLADDIRSAVRSERLDSRPKSRAASDAQSSGGRLALPRAESCREELGCVHGSHSGTP